MKILIKAIMVVFYNGLLFLFFLSCQEQEDKYRRIIENYMMENMDDPSSYQFVSLTKPQLVKIYDSTVIKEVFDSAYYYSKREENDLIEKNIKRIFHILKTHEETKEQFRKYSYDSFKLKLLTDADAQQGLGNFLIQKGVYEDYLSYIEGITENTRYNYIYKKNLKVYKKIFLKFRFRKDKKILLFLKEFRLNIKDSIIFVGPKEKIGGI